MSIRLGVGLGPFYVSASSRRRRRSRGKHARFQYLSYWLFGLFVIEGAAWVYAGIFLGIWWLLWATVAAVLGEVAKYRQLPAWWGPVMKNTRPVWPKRKSAATERTQRPTVAR